MLLNHLSTVALAGALFIGSAGGRPTAAEADTQTVFLFTSFRGDGDGLHLAWSYDARNWADLGQVFLKPVVGSKLMRDPHIAVFGDTFYLYPTTDGTEGWRATKRGKCYHYYSAQQNVGVAVADRPQGPFVHKRNGTYYLTWSEFDTRDPRYSVAYATGDSPLGPFTKAPDNPILRQSGPVKGAGHHSIVQLPGRDEWVIAYHRFRIPDGNGYNRETSLSPMRQAEDGRILPVDVFEAARMPVP